MPQDFRDERSPSQDSGLSGSGSGSSGNEAPTAEAISSWLVSKLSEELQIDPSEIDVSEPFTSYGISSVLAVSLSGDLEDWLGRPLSPTLVFDFPTIEALACHLSGEDLPRDFGSEEPLLSPREPIAVIGMACRLPGASDVESFWTLLRRGKCTVTEVPKERWDADLYYDPDTSKSGRMNTRWGGFLENVDEFDAAFFGISPREAVRMDPQQRLLLEVSWEAIEDAGLVLDQLQHSKTGVFIGLSTQDYLRLQLHCEEDACNDPYSGTGTAGSIASGRISYCLGLQGPNMTVDTACSSSLVAVHLACQSLRLRESDLALAGGVNLILTPEGTIYFSRVGAMAADGLCKTFDASADGYVRGEGCGVIVLKRLSDAEVDGDHIHAVIRGSAVNHDGRSSGLTVPNVHAQQAVIQEALKSAGVHPAEVSYVEAHGTGTSLGDPIEIQSLSAAYGHHRNPHQPLIVGSVKTNLGHLEAAAGITSLIKVILSLRHAEIPPHLHLKHPTPHVDWDHSPISIPSSLLPWKSSNEHKRIAGVSSFGFSGTNAHLIVEEAPPVETSQSSQPGSSMPRLFLLPLSARSNASLQELARKYRALLQGRPQAGKDWLLDLCCQASMHRTHHDHRLAVMGGSRNELIMSLEAYLGGEKNSSGFTTGKRPLNRHPKIALFLPGSSEGWLEIGRDLAEGLPQVAQTLRECDEWIRGFSGESVLAEILIPEGVARLGGQTPSLSAICSVQIALARLWSSWVNIDVMLGEDIGEIAARCVSGKLPLGEALKLAVSLQPAQRGQQPSVTLSSPNTNTTDLGCDVILVAAETIKDENLDTSSGAPISITLFQESSARLFGLIRALADLYSMGFSVNWGAVYSPRSRHLRLPSYAWERRKYWIESKKKDPEKRTSSPLSTPPAPVVNPAWSDWLYDITWEPASPCPRMEPVTPGLCVLFSCRSALSETIREVIEESGGSCILVQPGSEFRKVDDHRFHLCPEKTEGFANLFDCLRGRKVSRVLYLGLSEGDSERPGTLELVEQCLMVFLRTVQSLARETGESRIWVITRGAAPVGKTSIPLQINQAPLWGMGETLGSEYPNLWGGLIDVDPEMTPRESAEVVLEEVCSGGLEDRVAYRARQRYVARLQHLEMDPVSLSPIHFQKDRAYLITGGLGELGLKVAAWMVDQGAAHLILLGRSPLPPRNRWQQIPPDTPEGQRISAILHLESLGASILTASVDVASADHLSAFFHGYQEESRPPIRGVIHAAGVVIPQSFLDISQSTLHQVLQPKVEGADNLARLFHGIELDFMIFFSSASALFGSPFLATYAAANCYLDSLAHSLANGGKRVLSVNWGFWKEVGMAARYEKESGRPLALRGMKAMDPDSALEVLGALLSSGKVQAGVAPIEWELWSRSHPAFAASPFFSRVIGVPSTRQSALTGQPVEPLDFRNRIMREDRESGLRLLENLLIDEIASVLDMPPSDVRPDQPLTSLGVDSLMAVELRNWAEIRLGVVVPIVEFLKGPSAREVADWIYREILNQTRLEAGETQVSPGVLNPQTAESLLDRLDQLPEDQIDSLLASLIAENNSQK